MKKTTFLLELHKLHSSYFEGRKEVNIISLVKTGKLAEAFS